MWITVINYSYHFAFWSHYKVKLFQLSLFKMWISWPPVWPLWLWNNLNYYNLVGGNLSPWNICRLKLLNDCACKLKKFNSNFGVDLQYIYSDVLLGQCRFTVTARVSILPYHAATIFYWKWGWTVVKTAKVVNNHCGVPLCNNDKWYDGGKDLSDFSFPFDKQ